MKCISPCWKINWFASLYTYNGSNLWCNIDKCIAISQLFLFHGVCLMTTKLHAKVIFNIVKYVWTGKNCKQLCLNLWWIIVLSDVKDNISCTFWSARLDSTPLQWIILRLIKFLYLIVWTINFLQRISGVIDNNICYHSFKKLQTNYILSSHGGQKLEDGSCCT